MIRRLSSSVWVVWIVIRSSLTVVEVFGRHPEHCQQGVVPGLRVRARSQEPSEVFWRSYRLEEDHQDILFVIFPRFDKIRVMPTRAQPGIVRYYLVDGPPFEIHGAGEVFAASGLSARVVRAKISCSSMALSLSRFLKHPYVHLQQHQQLHHQAFYSRHLFLVISQTKTTPQIPVVCDNLPPTARCLDRSFY